MAASPFTILEKSSVEVAPLLLGWEVGVVSPEGEYLSGRIVETEAYHQDDPASHSYRGLTTRTAPMFAKAGTIYVYFTYGMHYCMNIVCGPEGRGEAVLLRALEPLTGLEKMAHNRGVKGLRNLTNGPAKLAQALGITVAQSGLFINEDSVKLTPPTQPVERIPITQTTRVGIRHAIHEPWRFYITGSPFVSKP